MAGMGQARQIFTESEPEGGPQATEELLRKTQQVLDEAGYVTPRRESREPSAQMAAGQQGHRSIEEEFDEIRRQQETVRIVLRNSTLNNFGNGDQITQRIQSK